MSLILPDPPPSGARDSTAPATVSLARAGSIGLHVVSGLIVGGAAGYFLNDWLGSRYWFPVFLALGLAAGIMNTVRDVRKLLREQENDGQNSAGHDPKD